MRACCLSKPFTYSDLLKSIQNLFGNRTSASIDLIRCLFSRGDALRLPVTNDDDLNKVLAIAKANRSNKLNFLITRKKSQKISRITSDDTQNDSGSMSDDGQTPELDDNRLDSPPPGTIAPQKRRTTISTPSTPTISNNDGGIFIPESVCLSFCYSEFFINEILNRVMIHIQLVVHLLPVENQVKMNIFQDNVFQVKFLFLIIISIKICFFLASSFIRRTASLSSNVSGGSSVNSNSSSSQISSSSSESLRTQGSVANQNYGCNRII